MVSKVFSLYDGKACAFMSPFLAANRAVAVRGVRQMVAQGGSVVAQYPGDFALFELGTFDDNSAQFFNMKVADKVGVVRDLIAQEDANG